MNLMLILSFCDIFPADDFNNRFTVRDFDLVQAQKWIRHSTFSPARLITSLLASKVQDLKAPVVNYTVKSKTHFVLDSWPKTVTKLPSCAICTYVCD